MFFWIVCVFLGFFVFTIVFLCFFVFFCVCLCLFVFVCVFLAVFLANHLLTENLFADKSVAFFGCLVFFYGCVFKGF